MAKASTDITPATFRLPAKQSAVKDANETAVCHDGNEYSNGLLINS